MLEEYNKNQCEALDIVALKKGGDETEFERHMRQKTEKEVAELKE